jgi:sulfur carrier protein ThiS
VVGTITTDEFEFDAASSVELVIEDGYLGQTVAVLVNAKFVPHETDCAHGQLVQQVCSV